MISTYDFNLVVDRQSDALYRFALKLCSDESTAQDLVQDSFEKLWIKRDEVEAEKAKSYLFTTLYHTFLNQKNRNQKVEYHQSENQVYSGTSFQAEYGLKEAIETAFEVLPEIQKSVIMLRDYEGYTYEEIADITKLSLAQVKVYIFRGRKTLQQQLLNLQLV